LKNATENLVVKPWLLHIFNQASLDSAERRGRRSANLPTANFIIELLTKFANDDIMILGKK
jgi:uncharacterized protein YcbX